MANSKGSESQKKPTVEIDGIDADEVADLLEDVAKQIRAKNASGAPLGEGGAFTRVNTGQLFDVVHRS